MPDQSDPILQGAQSVLDATPGHEDSMAIQCVMIVVGIGNDGQKWISHFRSGDLRSWEARGMVADLQDTLSAMEVARMFEADDE